MAKVTTVLINGWVVTSDGFYVGKGLLFLLYPCTILNPTNLANIYLFIYLFRKNRVHSPTNPIWIFENFNKINKSSNIYEDIRVVSSMFWKFYLCFEQVWNFNFFL
jgi:hypothetical protein